MYIKSGCMGEHIFNGAWRDKGYESAIKTGITIIRNIMFILTSNFEAASNEMDEN